MKKIVAYILIILFVCMNLNAIVMASVGINSEEDVFEVTDKNQTHMIQETETDEFDSQFDRAGGVFDGDNLPTEKLEEIKKNMKSSNLGYIFNSEEPIIAPINTPQPMSTPVSIPTGNIKVTNDLGTLKQYQPSIAAGPSGNIYIVWLEEESPTVTKVHFARSSDDGRTFEAFNTLSNYPDAIVKTPAIAVDSNEDIYVIWCDDRTGYVMHEPDRPDYDYDIWLNKSTNNGNSWLSGDWLVNPALMNNQTNPAIAIGPNNKIYVAWQDATLSPASTPDFVDINGILISNSTDGGATFSTAKTVYNTLPFDTIHPTITIDQYDYVWVAWSDNRTAVDDFNIYFSRSTTPGISAFNISKRVDDSLSGTQDYPTIAHADHNKVYVAWEDDRSVLSKDIYFARYNPATDTFRANLRLNNDNGNMTDQLGPYLAMRSGNIYACWLDGRNSYYETYFAKSTNRGVSFTTQTSIDDIFSNLRVSTSVSQLPTGLKPMAVHSNGNIYVVYPKALHGTFDIFLQNSTNAGNTWSESRTVSDDWKVSWQGFDNEYEIAVGPWPDYIVHVTWTDTREHLQGKLEDEKGHIYYANSRDFGKTFSLPTRVTSIKSTAQRNPTIAINQSWIYLAWTDVVNTDDYTGNIYFSYSNDGGQSFATEIKVNPGTNQSRSAEPDIEANETGTIYIAYRSFVNNDGFYPTNYYVYVAHDDFAGGYNFGVYRQHANDDSTGLVKMKFTPCVEVDPITNYIYVVWQDHRNDTDRPDIYFANSTNGGVTYNKNIRVDNTGTLMVEHISPALALNVTGTISVVWADNRNGNFDIFHSLSEDYGVTFPSNTRVNTGGSITDQFNPAVAISENNNDIYVTWEDYRNDNADIYMSKSTNLGSTFPGADVRVDDDAGGFAAQKPSIAVIENFTDCIFIGWTDLRNNFHRFNDQHANDYDIFMSRSLNAGTSFQKDYCIHTYQGDPAIAVDENGIIYAVWADYRYGVWGDIFFARSIVGGQHFSRVVQLSDDVGNIGRGSPDIAVRNGVIYVVWEDSTNNPTNTEIMFSKSTDGGELFTAPIDLTSGRLNKQINPVITVDKNDLIHVAFQDNFNPGPVRYWDIFYVNSTNGGTTWSTPLLINTRNDNTAARNVTIGVDESSPPVIYVAFENVSFANGDSNIYFTYSLNSGDSFVSEYKIDDDATNQDQLNPVMDVDSNGNISVVWEDYRNGSSTEWDLYFTRSLNKGASFIPNSVVNESIGNERRPDIAVDPTNVNNVTIIWQSDNDTVFPDVNYNIYMAHSTNGGVSFSIPERLDETTTGIRNQINPKVTMDPSGSIYTIWEDFRDGNGDIYFNMTIDRTSPVANASYYVTLINEGDYGHFIASGSWDNLGIETYTWTVDEVGSTPRYGYSARYKFDNPGVFTVTLTVKDYSGKTHTDSFQVTVLDLTPPIFGADTSDTVAYTGNTFNFGLTTVTDPNLAHVNVSYRFGSGSWVDNKTMSGTGPGPFTYTILQVPKNSLDPLYYYFWADDTFKNWRKLKGKTDPVPVLDDDLPEYDTNATASTATTGEPLTFSIVVTDNIDVFGGSVIYKYGASGTEDTLSMDKSGSTYTKTIQVNHTLNPIHYHFEFKDTSDNTNLSSESIITISDNDLPWFVADHSDTSANTSRQFNFSLEFDDNIVADSAHVEYKFGASGTPSTKTLNKVGNYFENSIIVPDTLTTLFYKFHFNDSTPGNENETIWFQVGINDNVKPSVVTGSGNIYTTTGESFEMFAEFTDNIDIGTVKVYYSKVGISTWLDTTITTGIAGNYSITSDNLDTPVDTTNDDTDWEYYLYAEDTSQNFINYGTSSSPFTIIVTDNDKPTADAGSDVNIKTGIKVTFDGSGSSDNIMIEAFKWTFTYDNILQSLSSVNPEFTFTIPGIYTVTLNVTDPTGNWDTDIVIITVASDIPLTVDLVYPSANAVIPDTSVTLRWTTDHVDAANVVYDVHWSESPNPPRREQNHDSTQYELTGLEDLKTYYWKIVPKLGGSEGTASEIRSFTINLEVPPEYGVDITADKTSLIITVGEQKTVTLTVKNDGNIDDFMNLAVDKKTYPDDVEISVNQLILSAAGSEDITLTIKTIISTPISNFTIVVTASSQGALDAGQDVKASVTIKVQTIKPLPEEKDKDKDGLPDDWEVKWFGNKDLWGPDDDPDEDGKSNYEEWQAGTDPTKAPTTTEDDVDGDELPDDWEKLHFGSIELWGKNDDPDNDGVTNYDEWKAGTDPTKGPEDGDGDGEEEEDNTMLYAGAGIAVVVIVIILLLLFMMMKKKKGGAEEKSPEEEKTDVGDQAQKTKPPLGGGGPGTPGAPGAPISPGSPGGPGARPGMGPGQRPGQGLIQ